MPLVFASLFGFIGALISRIGQWFLAAWLTGALKTMLIYTIVITAIAALVYNFVIFVNGYLVEIVNSMNPIGQSMLLGIASMLPKNLPYLLTFILTYYIMSIGLHIGVEIAKFKAHWANEAMKSFKA